MPNQISLLAVKYPLNKSALNNKNATLIKMGYRKGATSPQSSIKPILNSGHQLPLEIGLQHMDGALIEPIAYL